MFFILVYFVVYINHIILRTDLKANDMKADACSGCHSARKHTEHKYECGLNQECAQVCAQVSAGQGQEISVLSLVIYVKNSILYFTLMFFSSY
jgi:hypothetical protein